MLNQFRERLALPAGHWTPPEQDRCHLFVPNVETQWGARRIAMRSKSHNSGVILDPTDHMGKLAESDPEHNAILLTMADPEVRSFICQAPPIEYPDADGVMHEHFFDLLLEMWSSERRAVMIKQAPTAVADDGEVKDYEVFAAHLAEWLPEDFADTVVLLTAIDMPAWLLSNASLIRSSRLEPAGYLDEQVLERARSIGRPVAVRELLAPFDRGLRAVARLIYAMKLGQVEPGLLCRDAIVVATLGQD